jgi:hypothetical protein
LIVPVPLVDAVAVNVTGVPAHIGPVGFAAMETVGVVLGALNVIEMELDVAVVDKKQEPPPLIVISQVTLSPFANVVVVYTLELPV